MSIESREDAWRLAQQMVDRDAKITALTEKLRDEDMLGLECAETAQLEKLAAENATASRILAHWLLNHPLPPAPLVKPQINLVLVRPDSPTLSELEPVRLHLGGNRVTPAMLEAAEDLLHTLQTGERQLPKDLYEVVARAFGTTRDDAKGRILLALYGRKSVPKVTPPPEKPPE